mmetsp:Transcript_3425/g.10399  ORF Transcript_3425/g.10399 Transcript_3425/m.10399 type:complete len:213 (-) Transcript_3425:190-828(-)
MDVLSFVSGGFAGGVQVGTSSSQVEEWRWRWRCRRAVAQVRPKKMRVAVSMHEEERSRHPLEINLKWRDRVAVFAQICPEKTLDSILEALRENLKNGPRKDEGLEALYTFANFNVWQVTSNFFGRKMDLGQFERFRRVMITKPYEIIVNHEQREVLSAMRIDDKRYHARICFTNSSAESLTFYFTMSRTKLGDFDSWMVDSVLPDNETEHGK